MNLSELPTPCLVLDRSILSRNLDRMARAVGRHGIALRPHMKTAKSIEVARMALSSAHVRATGITVSTLAEAEYFSGHGINDILYAVGITPQKLDQVAKLNIAGADAKIITDDTETAAAISAHPRPPRTLIEIDCGEARGGMRADDQALLEVATRLGANLAGVVTHAGHSYTGRSDAEMAAVAEGERQAALQAAARLRNAGFACDIVSVGSSPTAAHAGSMVGITEARPGVYMFGDLFQAAIGTLPSDSLAVTVLASVIGRRPSERRLVVDAGAIALSKDRSTEATARDDGFGLVLDLAGRPSFGHSVVARANQEHGVILLDPGAALPEFRIGDRVRIAPNHVCLTAAAHDRYFVVDGDEVVAAIWPRINFW